MTSRLACLLAAALLASACVTTRAAAPVERPALEVPPVPPRIIEPAPAPEATTPEPVGELPPEKPAPPPARPRPPVARDGSKDTQKPADPKPVELPPAPVEQPPAPAQNTAPLIRTPATADAAAAERQIREALGRAQTGLKNINFQRLSEERKKAYNDVKDFIERAEAAIKASDFELAKGLASTAEKLTNELQIR
jgi:hypothetical protein